MSVIKLPDSLTGRLAGQSYSWLVTGAAGFIGSHLVENLLLNGQKVTGIDNFFSGKKENLDKVRDSVGEKNFSAFTFLQGTIEDAQFCRKICQNVDFVLHQAALGSVARSIRDPRIYNQVNVGGFVNMLLAAKESAVKSFVYASSSSVYGDEPNLPKYESRIGKALSPYALSKYFNEKYAELFANLYGIRTVGLRYFNVFGPRQDPEGEYAAVIPKWIKLRSKGETCQIFGDGTTSRDFCYVTNVVQANLLAALSDQLDAFEVFNVALGDQTSLQELYAIIDSCISGADTKDPVYSDFRAGDVKHSKADISLIREKLGFEPGIKVAEGLRILIESVIRELKS